MTDALSYTIGADTPLNIYLEEFIFSGVDRGEGTGKYGSDRCSKGPQEDIGILTSKSLGSPKSIYTM